MSIRTYAHGRLVEEVQDADAEARAMRALTRADLLGRVDLALTADLTYLALDPPTTGQAIAQVERLTRQVVLLLRVAGDHLDNTSGA